MRKKNTTNLFFQNQSNHQKRSLLWTFTVLFLLAVIFYFIEISSPERSFEELNLDFVSSVYGNSKIASQNNNNPVTPASASSQTMAKKQEKPANTYQQEENTIQTQIQKKTKESEPTPNKPKYAFSQNDAFEEKPSPKSNQNTNGNSKAGKGNSDYGFGIEGELTGRGISKLPSLQTGCTAKGSIVVDVQVDQEGKTTLAQLNYKHPATNSSDACLIQEALKIAKNIQWESSTIYSASGSLILNFQ